ncbi:ABC transporter permease [Brucella pseudogrignonensis]|uniref:ABC transporter permease n=1 Tax=Brucella pseudogrignonensis TaxID=419475 RepID=UPI003ECD1C42
MTLLARARNRDRLVAISVFMALILGWQLLSYAFPQEIVPGVPMVPGWQIVFTTTLKSLSLYWPGGWGFGSVAAGEEQSYFYAFLAIVYHSGATFLRLSVGFICGGLVGLILGLAISWSPWGRRLVNLPIQFMRVLPLLALIPLFQIWFGLSFVGEATFVAYAVGAIVFAAVVNAVGNVQPVFIENARTFGANRWYLYRTVILPAILPEMEAAVLLALGASWGAVLGAEFLGAQSGLGYILVFSRDYGYLDRMFLIALLVVLYATFSYWLAMTVFARINRWNKVAR